MHQINGRVEEVKRMASDNDLCYLLDHFENKIIIKGKIHTLSGLHIGSGQNNYLSQGPDNMIIRQANDNKPFIPGSSIKGVLRSYLEILLAEIAQYGKCCIVTDKPCLDLNKDKELLTQYKKDYKNQVKELAEVLYKELCPICRLFGSQVMASKIQIKDATLIGDTPIEIRDGVAINRDTGTTVDGKKYAFECVSAGAKFEFLMTIDNLEPQYEPLIKLLINALERGEIILGGRKSIGLGEVELIDTEIYKVDKANLLEYALHGESEEMRWQLCLKN